MKILIFLSHPAQFLFYKNAITELRQRGHIIFILTKTKDVLSDLLDELGWDYFNILPEERGRSKFQIIYSLFIRDIRLYRFTRKYKVDLLMGTDASLAHIGKITGIPAITTLEDDYNVIKNLARLTYPFSTSILVPEVCDVGPWHKKKSGYNGYMKLAYLHPNWFTPDRNKVTIERDKPYYLIRLSGLSAHHDFNIKGISYSALDTIIDRLLKLGQVCISSEKKLPDKYASFQVKIPVSAMHHYLFFSEMIICDSQSMAVEAAMLGVPGIRVSSFAGKISVLEELENKYSLTYGFKPDAEKEIFLKLEELLATKDLKGVFQKRRYKMLSEKIDVTSFLVWFIENYPDSVEIMKSNPKFQYKFM